MGFVVAAIQESIQGFVRSLAAQWDGKIFHDPLQKVRVTFLQTQNPSDAQVELVEPAAEDSPILSFLQKGGGLHHLCYEVTNLDSELDEMRSRGLVVVRKPLPAVAFENRRIAWLSTKQKLLLEFLEATHESRSKNPAWPSSRAAGRFPQGLEEDPLSRKQIPFPDFLRDFTYRPMVSLPPRISPALVGTSVTMRIHPTPGRPWQEVTVSPI